jgi:hypothetical protein
MGGFELPDGGSESIKKDGFSEEVINPMAPIAPFFPS